MSSLNNLLVFLLNWTECTHMYLLWSSNDWLERRYRTNNFTKDIQNSTLGKRLFDIKVSLFRKFDFYKVNGSVHKCTKWKKDVFEKKIGSFFINGLQHIYRIVIGFSWDFFMIDLNNAIFLYEIINFYVAHFNSQY